ncbi:Protein FAR1-RELATED SEQUENCE 7 [Platanthera zijinensis]|uniref:Protein FAR1-RELATED SEQUENCE 7 n=1 Tax=Platanthera zijinensis TaxID=2320716 RepID=A0AAP0G3P1_9ASPA
MIIKGRGYCCSKSGVKVSKPTIDDQKRYRKLDARTGCLACIYFNADKEGKNWEVTKFVEEHNHPLASENDKHLLRSQRSISNAQASLLKNMTGVGIRTTDAYNFLVDEVGGVENVGFSKTDAYNFVQRERKALIDSGDAMSLSNILRERQSEDNMFSYDIQTDEMNRLISFFWIDGRSKIDYDCFGAVIIFDTTYRLNKYNLACAPFIAVNHHMQNIFVGGAFIATETIESFCWVFETFLRFVGGKQPITIFTDQDQTMTVSIERVFSNTRHRLCQWHISKKAPSKVPAFNHDRCIRSLFYNCMSKCESEVEFENSWSDMIRRGNLGENRWLQDLFKVRMKWSTAFNKERLDLGILLTQRSESANNVLHGCFKATSSLVECYLGLDKLTSSWRRSEHDEDFRCKHGSVTLKYSDCLLLKKVSKIYTRKCYSLFEQSFMDGAVGVCIVEESRLTDERILYVLQHSDIANNVKQWFVSFHPTNYDADCSCRGFQTRGILCKHILRVYNHKNVTQLPEKYILRRFTVSAKKDVYRFKTASQDDFDSNLVFRSHMMRFTYDLTRRVEDCKIAREYVLSAMNDIAKKSDEILEHDEKVKNGLFPDNQTDKGNVRDPPAMRRKGRSNNRRKSHWEKPTQRNSKKLVFK